MVTSPSNIDQHRNKIREILGSICDPEIPVLTLDDMGIIRSIDLSKDCNDNLLGTVYITPTYSGCPAMDLIETLIRIELQANGYHSIDVKEQLFPSWTTAWMSENGKRKLKEYGIAPPKEKASANGFFSEPDPVECPRCQSKNTHRQSEFGTTACKSLWVCDHCHEPFDHFKCH